MNKAFLLLLLGFLGVGYTYRREVPVCSGGPHVKGAMKKVAAANSFFGMSVSGRLRLSNTVLSPYCYSTVLAMLLGGAEGKTRFEIISTLGLQKGYKDGFKQLIQSLSTVTNVTLRTATAVYVEKSKEVTEDFQKETECYFGSRMKSADFLTDSDTAKNEINSWVSETTNGTIKDLLSSSDINSDTKMVLISAIYFKGEWINKFKPSADIKNFRGIDGKKKADFMEQTNLIKFKKNDLYTIVRVPYLGDRLAFYVVIPKRDGKEAFKKVGKKLYRAAKAYKNLLDLSKITPSRARLIMPKFKMETKLSLKKILKSLGMRRAFETERAEFGKLTVQKENLYISDVFQKAFIEVNEAGSEAGAAAGAVVNVFRSVAANPEMILVDKPFHFFIQDDQTQEILFHGKYATP